MQMAEFCYIFSVVIWSLFMYMCDDCTGGGRNEEIASKGNLD